MTDSTTPAGRAAQTFARVFKQTPEHTTQAPGRVNLIGEHTDYNDGFVFPLAIQFHTAVAVSRRVDRTIRVVAHDEQDQQVQFDIDTQAHFDTQAPWSNYVRGVVQALTQQGFRLCGADLVISGNVPMGAGLSSSASLEMSVISALTTLSNEPIDAVAAARIGQAAENNFVGCQCGIMDQLISAAAQPGYAMQLDCRSLSWRFAKLPPGTSVLVVDSQVQRKLVDGEYNRRREQCEEVAKACRVQALRDLTLPELVAAEPQLNPVSYRRARHVLTENQRTLAMASALEQGAMQTISTLMAASHRSMRDDFAITVPEIDKLTDLIDSVIGQQGGVRMTGGGFGGCVVALLPDDLIDPVLAKIDQEYADFAGHSARGFVCTASRGAFAEGTELP